MNLDEAKQRGCPDELLNKLEEAGIVSIGEGIADGENYSIDWNVIGGDLALILDEA